MAAARGLLGPASGIEALMVLGAREGTEAGRNGIGRARLDMDSVGRIGVDQMHGGAVEEPVYVVRLAGIAAH
jgi:hypothetical protein